MFLSKKFSFVRNIISAQSPTLQFIGAANNLRLFSDILPASQQQVTGTPDKLYRKVEIELRGNDIAVLQSYGVFATTAAGHLGVNVTRNTVPRKPIKTRFTVLKSAFVHKDHRVQYEFRTYYRYIDLEMLTGSTADTILEYFQRNLPEGVAMKVTKHEIQQLPEAVRNPPDLSPPQ